MQTLARRLVWVCGLLLAPALQAAAAGQVITLLHLNDTHSHLDSFGPKDAQLSGTIGGLTRAATVIKAAQDRNANTLLLHGGDLFAGDLFFNRFFGVPELQVLRDLGLEAMVVGNHELDLGPDVLARTAVAAALPPGFLLGANVDTSGCGSEPDCAPLLQLIQASRVVEIAGVRVGVFGMTTPDDRTMMPSPLEVLGRGHPGAVVAAALAAAAELRASGADVVILLSHLGLAYDEAIANAQDAGPQIDFILGGHDHLALTSPIEVRGTRIVSAGAFYRYVGQLRFSLDGSSVRFEDYALLPVGPDVAPDPATQALVDSLEQDVVARYGDVYGEVIAEAGLDLGRDHDPARPSRDTALGNLVTDSYRFATRSDVGLTATGFIAERIWKGPILPADVFRSVPYGYDAASGLDARLVRVGLRGSELLRGIEVALDQLGTRDALELQVSGLRYHYDSRKPSLQRIVPGSAQVKGRPIEPDRVYSVTANQLVATILERDLGWRFESRELTGVVEYVALRDYVRRLAEVTTHAQGRIADVGDIERHVASALRPAPARRAPRPRPVVPRQLASARRPPSPRRE